jgi:predicted nucleic acid-binding protein
MASIRVPRPTRVFIDTSVLFASAVSGSGFARDLVLAGTRGELEIVVNHYVILETRRNLEKKAPQALGFFEAFLSSEAVQPIEPPFILVQQVAESIEPKDAPIVAGAMYVEARFIATFDRRHLLAEAALIEERFGILVQMPGLILATVTAEKRSHD